MAGMEAHLASHGSFALSGNIPNLSAMETSPS
jgi:hypothetical protein